jgi:NADPH:quinone reductase-like Zn-dependent oxidoreductase
MKAITYDRYGPPDVLQLRDVDRPAPGEDDVLVRVRAASINPRDWHLMRGEPYFVRAQLGLRAPKDQRIGTDLAGVVEAAGSAVTRFEPGDEVYAEVPTGAFAEYVCVAEDLVAAKPANASFEEAAAIPLAALTALQALRDTAGLQAGQSLLVIGAGGGVGTFAVQLGVWLGAEVTGVCSTSKLDLVRSLGADHVIDYTRQDGFGRHTYDVVFQVAGERSPWDLRRALEPRGTLLLCSGESRGRWIGPASRMLQAFALRPFVRQRLEMPMATPSRTDLELVAELVEKGTLTPVIGRTLELAEVPEAIRHLEEGHARGKIVITV